MVPALHLLSPLVNPDGLTGADATTAGGRVVVRFFLGWLVVRWLIDGMNVIGTRPDGWWKDRDRAMERLVDLIERWAAAAGDEVTVVFERPPSPPLRSSVIEVAHAPAPRPHAADDEIVRRLKQLPDRSEVRVVTSDRWLADQAWALGAAVLPADSFRSLLES